ncbi:hypothetical protein C7V51_13715 [Rathayibacter iranicus]|uniref:Uncharacterized protein n=1 Tax=Rathayibacter iranicus TaxID=59737 RepID=A0AAD1AER5_9MICO|nr:hypothetical protein C7V51_13715 [Rathayibacter iranicus]
MTSMLPHPGSAAREMSENGRDAVLRRAVSSGRGHLATFRGGAGERGGEEGEGESVGSWGE